jgi:hypothetical protein
LYSISDISNTQRTINYTQRAINPILTRDILPRLSRACV